MHPIARSISVGALQSPLLGAVLSPLYRRYFDRAAGHRRLFQGIYHDFASATNDIPRRRPIGYDNPMSAVRVAHARNFRSFYDYPVLFWLIQLLKPGTVVFDWGGNVGISYYAFRHHLRYPDGLQWVINDVPAVLAVGRQIAAQEQASGLLFTTSFDRLSGADILLSAGAFQFIEDPLGVLRSIDSLPPQILINKVPVYDKPHAVTVQNMGTSFCPYHLFNRTEFIDAFRTLGYDMIDTWQNPGLGCFIPFHPEYSIIAFSGFYFRSDRCSKRTCG